MKPADDKIREVIGKVITAESTGATIPDNRVIARHPSLAIHLPQALESLKAIRLAEAESLEAGTIRQSLRVCSLEELEAPILDDLSAGSEAFLPQDQISQGIVGYELLEQIGRGGQATVYRARKIATDGVVAIKILPGGFFASSRARSRFEQEAKALVRINHPNVVPILDKGRTRDGSMFLVMPHIQGVPLDQYFADGKNQKDIPSVFAKLASAIHELHRQGVLHRDLKPSNVFIDQHGQPQVLDFGLARVTGGPSVTDTGQILGSLQWASPEQVAGNIGNVSERSDIYAIGMMLAVALDGQTPYPTKGGALEIAHHIVNTQPRIGQGRKPLAIDAITLKCLAKNATRRFASADELAQQLVQVKFEPILAWRSYRPSRSTVVWLCVSLWAAGAIAATIQFRRNITFAVDKPNVASLNPEAHVIELPRITNSLGMNFVNIPAGTFTMGSPLQQPGRGLNEERRLVHIANSFYLCTTETTQGQYKKVMGKNPSDQRNLGNELPVNNVSFKDGMEFCDRLARIDGRRYRLPTESEWEYASKTSPEGRGLSDAALAPIAWFEQNSEGRSHRVGTLKANEWGIYDMLGNVAEWCDIESSLTAPDTDGIDALKIVKGGGFDSNLAKCRSAARHLADQNAGFPNLGFRIVLTQR